MAEVGSGAMLTTTVITLCFIGVTVARDLPVWPDKYSVQGVLHLPYAEINEPFATYYDKKSGLSRTDYYGCTMQTVQVAPKAYFDADDFGKNYKIAPMTNYNATNVKSCFLANGTKDNPADVQSVLPDMAGFSYIGLFTFGDNVSCDLFQNVTSVGNKKNTYTIWVQKNTNVPVQYEMFGYDSLLGSHYDKYLLTYTNFSNSVDPAMLNISEIAKGLTCGGFPGPGMEHGYMMNPMSEYVQGEDSHHELLFKHFKHKHSKNYASAAEETRRHTQFRHNVRFIHSKNRQGLTYTLAVNHLADKTKAELKALNGRRPSKGYNGGLPFNKDRYDLMSLPDHVDWRLYGAVTQVKDQAVCGSCWSFGTTGALEGAYFLKTGKLVRLSQQQLIDCSWGELNNGCDGGEDFRAYQWIIKHGGIASEEDYGAYLAIDGYCKLNVSSTALVKGYVNVSSEHDPQALKVAIAKHGPISVGIDASHRSLSFYSNGVYYEPECGNKDDDLDHAVLAVGYGVLNGEPYWLVKNSWSTYWGNNGYVLMSQKNNNCGVATQPTFVLM